MQATLGRSQREPHATKRGPGRRHKAGTYRGGKAKKMNFAAALMAHWAAKRAGSRAHKLAHPLRDAHGAYTVVGPMFNALDPLNPRPELLDSARHHDAFNGHVRRIWLAGISAQRGY